MNIQRRKSPTALLIALSALSAIGIVLGKFLAFNVTEFMRFSLENLSILFTGIVFGPWGGLAVGIVQDLVGCLIVGYAINPIITLGSATVGLISGAVFGMTRSRHPLVRISLSVASAHLLGSVLTKSVGLAVFYSLPLGVTAAWRLLNYLIVGTAEVILLYLMLKSKPLLSQINKIKHFSPFERIEKGDTDHDL